MKIDDYEKYPDRYRKAYPRYDDEDTKNKWIETGIVILMCLLAVIAARLGGCGG